MHRLRTLVAVGLVPVAFAAVPVLAQEATTGGISGRVFFETTAQGADGQVWVQAFRLPDLEEARGACVEGFEYEINGLEPGEYKLRLGFGCGVDRDKPPYEWFVQTDAPECAAEIVVAAGFVTDGINADVNRDKGAERACAGEDTSGGQQRPGVQRPIADPSPTQIPTGEIEFTPGIVAAPGPGTPWGTVVGFAVGLLVLVAAMLLWLAARARQGRAGPPSVPPPAA